MQCKDDVYFLFYTDILDKVNSYSKDILCQVEKEMSL